MSQPVLHPASCQRAPLTWLLGEDEKRDHRASNMQEQGLPSGPQHDVEVAKDACLTPAPLLVNIGRQCVRNDGA